MDQDRRLPQIVVFAVEKVSQHRQYYCNVKETRYALRLPLVVPVTRPLP